MSSDKENPISSEESKVSIKGESVVYSPTTKRTEKEATKSDRSIRGTQPKLISIDTLKLERETPRTLKLDQSTVSSNQGDSLDKDDGYLSSSRQTSTRYSSSCTEDNRTSIDPLSTYEKIQEATEAIQRKINKDSEKGKNSESRLPQGRERNYSPEANFEKEGTGLDNESFVKDYQKEAPRKLRFQPLNQNEEYVDVHKVSKSRSTKNFETSPNNNSKENQQSTALQKKRERYHSQRRKGAPNPNYDCLDSAQCKQNVRTKKFAHDISTQNVISSEPQKHNRNSSNGSNMTHDTAATKHRMPPGSLSPTFRKHEEKENTKIKTSGFEAKPDFLKTVQQAMYETNVKDLAASRSVHSFNSQQKEPTTRDEDFSPGEIEYTTNQILYSYWWCFWHVCLRCVRRVRLTPATRDEFGFHPEVLSPDQLGDPSNTSFHLSKMNSGPNGNQMQPDARDVEACRPSIRPMCTMPTFQSFRIEGRVTTSCLWHACRAVTIGTILIGTGITMAILGYLKDQKEFEEQLRRTNMTMAATLYGPGQDRQDRFQLNDMSFAGPVIMGIGGFLIVAACVMTFEARDSATKIVPTAAATQKEQFQHLSVANLRLQRNQPKRFVLQKPAETQTSPTSSFYLSPQNQISTHPQPLVNFKSSSSQTTFLDRNIVDNLTLQLLRSPKESLILTKESFDEVEESCAGTITTAAPSSIGAGQLERLRHESGQAKMSPAPYMKNITASWSCSGASACGGSSTTTKRASSISGNLPEVMTTMEPGLALMDEIGRRALTNAFIQFSRDNGHITPYNTYIIPELAEIHGQQNCQDPIRSNNENEYLNGGTIRKCPSDPYIQKSFNTPEKTKEGSNKKYENLPSMMITPASVSNSTSLDPAVQITISQPEQKRKNSTSSTSRSFTPSEHPERSTKSDEPLQQLRFKNDITDGFDLFSGYKVLTPTMYRSRMAAARQAVSMDCYYSYQDEDDQNSRTKSQLLGRGIYKGDKIHGKASTKKFDPLSNRNSRKFRQRPRIQDGIDISKELAQQKSTTSGEYSFDLELGASASKVYQRQKEKEMMESLKPSSCLQKLPKEYTGSSMLLDLHIEGSGPVTLLVRDESRSTRSTSACLEDDQCNSDENIAQIEEKCIRRVNDIQQVLGSTVGDESFDTLSMVEERKRRRRKNGQGRKHPKKKLKSEIESKGKFETSMSVASSKSSLFLDSESLGSEKGDDNDKLATSSDDSKQDDVDDKSSISSNKKETRHTTLEDELSQMDFIDENAATDYSGSDINSSDQEWASCSNELLDIPSSHLKLDSSAVEDEDDSALISAISVLDNSRWGAREKKKERHRSKELLATKKNEGCADNDDKHSASGSKSQLSTSQSSSLAGSSELDVWSPIQKHYEEDLNQLLSNVKPSKTCHNIGYRSSINILDTERSSKPRAKLVHQIRSDGVLVVARRASSESMSSIFHTSDIRNQQEVTKESKNLTASCSFGDDKEDASSSAFPSSQSKNDEECENGRKDDFSSFKAHGHKRGLSIKGSCRRQWLRNQSKVDKTKRKIDISKDNTTVPEDCEATSEQVIQSENLPKIEPIKNSDLEEDDSHDEEKETKKKKKQRSVKATVEF